jgi:hypothetical protein
MSSIAISSIVFGCVFGGAMVGMVLRAVLPKHYLSEDSKDAVKVGMGLVATMAALVLGLLVSSAKSSFDALSSEMTRVSSQIILLDRTLSMYGEEAKEARDLLRSSVARVVDRMESTKSANSAQLRASTREVDVLYERIQGLVPKDERQRSIQGRALGILISLQETRWLMYEQESTSISMPMLMILLSWLVTLFISFGLFSPVNGTGVTTLLVSALSVSGAILLILELYRPYEGMIRLSSAPLRAALMQLGN